MPDRDWSRKLTEPVDLGGRRKLRTLADVRAHLMSLPESYHQRPAFGVVADLILQAAEGKDVGDISVVLRLARQALRLPDR